MATNINHGAIKIDYTIIAAAPTLIKHGCIALNWSPLPYYNPIVRISQTYSK